MDNYRYYLSVRVLILKSSGQDSFPILYIRQVHQSVLGMGTLMVVPLVTLVVMLPFLSIPAWSMDLSLAERAHLLQLLHVPHLPSNFSLRIDSFGFGMINFSQSGISSSAYKWYNYRNNNVPSLQGIGSGLIQIRRR